MGKFPKLADGASYIAGAITTHWRLWSWLAKKALIAVGRTAVRKPRSMRDLWSKILSGTYQHGDIIRI